MIQIKANSSQFGAVDKVLNLRDKRGLEQEKRHLPASIQASDHSFEVQGRSGKEAVVLCCL